MAVEWRDLGNGAYGLLSGSNIGVIAQDRQAVMIDAGLDQDAAKKALRAIEGLDARLTAVLITHGHADHFGGAGWLAQAASVPVYAPPLEGAFVTHPILEPLFLYGGAAPIAELRGKFTLARQGVAVTGALLPGPQEIAGFALEGVALPGHAPEQVGIARGDMLYCGDVVFPQETLARHPILFCTDLDAWLETLERLPTLPYARFVPGHGEPLQDIAQPAKANADRLREIRGRVWEALAEPQEPQAILRAVAARYGVTFAAPQFFFLALTTVHAALTSLQRAGEAKVVMDNNHLLWQRA
jgi:glyoxylase-like metal-dependent hydrolase (beta-lactamase superfamily II)